MNIIKKCIFIYLIILLITCGKIAFADDTDKKLTVILVPDFSFQEVKWLNENGRFLELWRTGGMSAMNIRPDGPYSYLNNTVTIASGVRSLGVEGWNGFIKGEFDGDVLAEVNYQQWTGEVVDEGVIFHPLFHKLVDKNKETTYRSEIGILGELLKNHGIESFVIGTSDSGPEKIRYGSLMTMDQEGKAKGLLLEGTKKSEGSPWGMVMDVDNILLTLSTINNTPDPTFTVVEWGDLHRLFKQKGNMTSDYFLKQYEQSLFHLELFISKLLLNDYTQNVMLVSPMVHSDAYQSKERLAPFFYWEDATLQESYYLLSATTRQPFVLSNLDIVPTLLDFYEIKDKGQFFGKPLQKIIATSSTLEEGLKTIDLMFLVFKTRNVILSSYITLLVLLLIITSVIIMFREQNDTWKGVAKILLISGISSPLWLLLTPYSLNYIQPNIYLLLLIFCSFLTGYLVVKFIPNPIFFLSVVLFLTITIDLFIGNYLMQRSYLGYDPVIGARYYGIGNEYAGVYLISGLLLLEHSSIRRWFLLLIIGLSQLYLLSSTSLGANAGATLAAGIMFAYFSYRCFFPKANFRIFLLIFSSLGLITLILLFLTQLNGQESHIGYAFSRFFQGDLQYIFDTIQRKLEMNWKIFRFSNWTQLFVTTYLLIALYLWRKKEIVRSGVRRILIQTGVVASIALLLLNDSGVVAAATSMFIIVCTSYYWALENYEL
ncbi:hypothetical protein AWH56_009680 [Anaerobacillus isosaccharinicus]|uniref:Uncharacterized protein n=1 Tax=Anaerobacillus isosaccharinicus TaxID=1532552 RepID=A0A1S2ME14_9BACI|nr:hypothetical protein [Anaerobacillus isosaccharinicus]MBA5588798.1 hypothetical protein [Anaerobacillus isosaccharinicus]QOY37807.1 hypothetical protein AWH56_009680 [Anaerobacillus isosaccharinicus]